MANTKKITAKSVEKTVDTVENVSADSSDIAVKNDKLSLSDMVQLVNTIVDSVIVNRNGTLEFAAEYLDVVENYVLMAAFYPQYGIADIGLALFFNDYINGVFFRELKELEVNGYAQYIRCAVEKKIEFKLRQIENPLINSATKFVDTASALTQKYVDDIDNVGTADIKGFLSDFSKLVKKTNPQTVTDAVIKLHKSNADGNSAEKPTENAKSSPKKRTSKSKSSTEKSEG